MLVMIMLMAGLGMYIEMRIVNSITPLGDLLERFRLGALAFSLVLSMLLGMMFGAAGLIVFMSGVLSTVMIQPWYAMRKNGTLSKVRAVKTQTYQSVYATKDLNLRRLQQVLTFTGVVAKVIFFPLVLFGWSLDQIDKLNKK